MSDVITTFFDHIASEPQEAVSRLSATIRFDVDTDNGHGHKTHRWLLTADKGTVAVSSTDRDIPADAVIHVHRALLERMVTGEVNAMAATLRGEVGVEGDAALLVAFQRMLPGPPSTQDTSVRELS